MPSTVVGRRDAGDVEDGRRDVDDVGELRAEPATRGNAVGPMDDHRIARPAEVRADLLAPLEGGVAGPGPSRPVVRGHDLGTPGIHPAVPLGQLELHLVGQGDAVLHGQLVERAGDRALHARAIVAPDPDDERVVELTQLVDGIDHPTDVMVGVLREAGIDLHLAGVERLELVWNAVPGRERLVARRQLRLGRHHAERLLARERLLAQPVPALVELALVLGCPRFGDMVRGMAAAGREEREERLLRILGPDPV